MIKKSTKIILSLALLFIVGGSFSSFFLYQNLKTQREKNEVRETFAYDGSETLILNFNRSTHVTLTKSTDDRVHMEKTGLPLDQRAVGKLKWNIDKKDKETTVSIDNEKATKTLPFNFSFFDYGVGKDSINLSLPSGYKKIIVNGRQVNLNIYDFSPESLEIKVDHGDIYMQNVNAKEIKSNTVSSTLRLEEVKATQDIEIKTQYGGITVLESHARKFDLTSTSGDIFTGNTHGDLTTKTNDGFTSINHTYGKILVESKNSDIFFHSIFTKDDIDLTSAHGNLEIELDKKGWEKAAISIKTHSGIITELMDEELENGTPTLETKKGSPQLKADTKSGNIAVRALEEDDTHYEFDDY